MGTFNFVYEFYQAFVQLSTGTITGDSATDTFTADAAHGLAVGDTILMVENGGGALTEGSRYYVVLVPSSTTFKVSATLGGAAATFGTGTNAEVKGIRNVEMPWPNQAQVNAQTQDYTFEGGAEQKVLTVLRGMALTFASAVVPASAHADVFDKTAVTGNLPSGLTSAQGYGGGNDRGGVSCGLLLKSFLIESVDGVEATSYFGRWFPIGTLTYTGPASLQTGQVSGTTGYTFTATKTAVDIVGGTIAGAATGGDFFFDGKLSA